MVIRWSRFNSYLLAAALVVGLSACETTNAKRDKQVAVLRIHAEVNRDDLGYSEPVKIPRSNPITLQVNKEPFLQESEVKEARVIESHGSFSIAIQFDRRGVWLLEQYTAMNPGKHLAIAAQFGEKLKETRWLAAPQITRRISDGVLVFAPDATREEAETIVRGLNYVAVKSGNQPKKPKSETK